MKEIEKEKFDVCYSGWDGYYLYYENALFENLASIIDNIHLQKANAVVNITKTNVYYTSTVYNGRISLYQKADGNHDYPASFML